MDLPKPDIRPDVNKEEKKPSGFWSGLASLLGRNPVIDEAGVDAVEAGGQAVPDALSTGAPAPGAAGAGGEGFLESLSRLGFGGGVMATKAGIIALAVGGSALAGGVGFLGYKAMHAAPGAPGAHSFWPFAAPAAQKAGAVGAGGASAQAAGAGQTEDSLASLRAANPAAARAAMAQAAGAKAGAAAGRAAAGRVAAAGSAGASGGGAGSTVRGIPTLNDNGFKSGSWRVAGGGSGASFTPKAGAASSPGRKAAQTTGFGATHSLASLAKSGLQGLGLNGAVGQARQVNGEMTNPGYGGGASRYDTGGVSGGTPIGGAAGVSTGGSGTGSGSGAGNANGPTNGGSAGSNQFGAPPTPQAGSNAAPWQGMLNEAMMMIFAAAVLIYIANKLTKSFTVVSTMATVLASIAALLGIIVVTLGASIGSGGQQAVGSMLTLSGGLVAASAIAMALGSQEKSPSSLLTKIAKYAGVGAIVAAMGAYMQSGAMSGTGSSGGLGGFASIYAPSARVAVVQSIPSERIG